MRRYSYAMFAIQILIEAIIFTHLWCSKTNLCNENHKIGNIKVKMNVLKFRNERTAFVIQ